MKANHLVNPNRIYAGQKLLIPTKGYYPPPPPVPPHVGFWYRVKPGDTLSAIGWRYGVSPWAIAAANGLRNINCIFAGQKLWIPDP
jgi:LysM repeat protein